MGRAERELDPLSGPVQRFAYDLRLLRIQAGSPSYRELSRHARYAPSVLSRAASGRELPSRNVTLAYVTACGGDTEAWRERWMALAAAQRGTHSAGRPAVAGGDDSDTSEPAEAAGQAPETAGSAGSAAQPSGSRLAKSPHMSAAPPTISTPPSAGTWWCSFTPTFSSWTARACALPG